VADLLRFDGRVAIVTGAGNGLGRAHALALAARGAKVVVNDLGGDVSGSGASSAPADKVVAEIKAAGGQAVASAASVVTPAGGEAIVATAIETFGRIDVLVNNAGVLDTDDLLTSTDEHIDLTLDTHLRGAFSVTRPALRYMLEQGYGRIVNTSSGAVLGSPMGLAYQSAKSGIIAFTRALALMGAAHNVKANAVLPTAFTRMTDSIPDPEFRNFMESRFTPNRVAETVALLAHEHFPYSGELFLSGAGRMARLFLGVTQGFLAEEPSAEDFLDHLDDIMSTDGYLVPADRGSEFASYLPRLGFDFKAGTKLVADRD
jgi:NAD(P)-dependent dehydrogenase (short-subunit alcohol dehydrogenase family)